MNKKSKRVMIALYIAGLIMVVLSSWMPGITSLTVILLFITMSSLWCLMMSVFINMSNEYNYQRIIYDKNNKIGLMGQEIHNLTNTLRAKQDFIDTLNSNNITNRLKKNLDIDSVHEPVSPRNVNVGDGPMNGDYPEYRTKEDMIIDEIKMHYDKQNQSEKL